MRISRSARAISASLRRRSRRACGRRWRACISISRRTATARRSSSQAGRCGAYLVLDEPTAGLDPRGRRELLALIRELHAAEGTTIVFVSHNMEDVFAIADEVVVLRQGEILLQGAPTAVFAERERIAAAGLRQPALMQLMTELRAAGVPLDEADAGLRTPADAAAAIARALKGKEGSGHAQ